MEFQRTPDSNFASLIDWPYEPRYVQGVGPDPELRMAYVDEGPRDGPVALCLHGEPTWGYLYRKMIPPLVAAGYRVVAPDFFGFGRSDKPTDDAVYTWSFHRQSLLGFLDAVSLERFTLVCQDWGGLLGLTIPVDKPAAVQQLLVMNTALGIGKEPGPGFKAWLVFAESQPDLDVAALMKRAVPGLSDAEAAAYAAPFVDVSYKAGVRRFPGLVPIRPDMDGAETSVAAAKWWQEEWNGPSFMAIGMQDPVLGAGLMRRLHAVIKGCPEPLELHDAGHFVQEHGAAVVEAALASFAAQT